MSATTSGRFTRLATRITTWAGSPAATFAAFALILAWAGVGPLCHFSQAWQLWINSATTIITYLMVFVIQHTANRETLAIRLKLDELIRATTNARDEMVRIEQETDEAMAAQKERMDRAVSGEAPGGAQ